MKFASPSPDHYHKIFYDFAHIKWNYTQNNVFILITYFISIISELKHDKKRQSLIWFQG